ncbi:hypothetical protein ABOM_011126 [Aspergillus bombycis]|uniref:Major facilitator superfamily (MFS) profile domain-containing protein n=1 Tax=Aspergillus bombycis TaxID=109264 RepID=A0A1F7ZNB1_9EURO|nr:hypothetical protein ABOM_011126 [Aspergillus bombycis]OGM40779.1 hypothetical protein ABOM_011126 [Aspergillus bombycis]
MLHGESDPVGYSRPFSLGISEWLVFGTLAIITLVVAWDGTSLSVALPSIAEQLHATATEAFWSGTSFLLCSTVFQPSFASLSNIYGRKPLIFISLSFFVVGTGVAGAAKNVTYMLVGRSLQGVGGGGLVALTEIVVADLVPLRLRGQYMGIINAVWSVGSVTGPVLGGGFVQKVSWRWIFYINFPFAGIALIMLLCLRLRQTTVAVASLKRIDYSGTFLFVGGTASFLIGLSWGGTMYAWRSWRTVVPMVVGVVALALFVLYERFYAVEPMIPPRLFHNRTALGYSPVLSGVALFPTTFTVAPSAVVVGIYITKFGRYRWAILLGWAFSTLGAGLCCMINADSGIPRWVFPTVILGVGMGICLPSILYAIQASSHPKDVAIAVAMYTFFRTFGQALGVAIGGVIFQNRMRKNLLEYPALAPFADQYSADAAALVPLIQSMPNDVNKVYLKQAYADSLKIVWATCCALMAAAGLLSGLTRQYDLNQTQEEIEFQH